MSKSIQFNPLSYQYVLLETIRKAICRSGGTPGGAFPYRKQKTPQFDERIQKQRYAYAMWSPVGLAARDDSFDEEKKKWIFWDHTPVSKEGAINRSHDPCWLTKEDRDAEGVPAAGSSKFSLKVNCTFCFQLVRIIYEPQGFAAVSWNARAIHLHCNRRRKKRSGPTIKKEYRIELESVNAQAVAKVVEEEFGPIFQAAGGKVVFGDNDKKLHSVVTLNFCNSILE